MSADDHDIRKLQAMDDAAWAALQEDYFRRVYFFCKRYCNDHQTAEDLTQDVFLGAVRGIATFDRQFTLDQFVFGIAKNRVIDHFRKHKIALVSPKGDDDADGIGRLWLENMADEDEAAPKDRVVASEDEGRKQRALAQILREFVGELWSAGEFDKLMVLESLFVLGRRNKDVAVRFGIADEKLVAGIKFRAIDKLRGLARKADPNHTLFRGLWSPGAR
jgi:RNA polymerase sigma-70 factor (ECF subfamily)